MTRLLLRKVVARALRKLPQITPLMEPILGACPRGLFLLGGTTRADSPYQVPEILGSYKQEPPTLPTQGGTLGNIN